MKTDIYTLPLLISLLCISGCSSDDTVAPVSDVSSAPQNLHAAKILNKVNLNWQTPAGNGGNVIINNLIYRGRTAGNETNIAQIVFNTTHYTDSLLQTDTTYYY